jgi:superoxide dismutase, Fe-Mn family
MNLQPAWALALDANFGSFDGWRSDFAARADALRSGAGRVVLGFLQAAGTLENRSIVGGAGEADGFVPLLALDAQQAANGLVAFVAAIDWNAVYERYQNAVHAASETIGADADDAASALLLDVRRAGAFEAAGAMAAGSAWRDPAAVERWGAELPPGREVLVYCVYGHEVGRATALRLRAAGVKACFLRGGFDAWQAAGRPLLKKEPKT